MPGATEGSTGPIELGPVGMFDDTCPKCRKRFGWRGTIFDKPPCPKCGHHKKVNKDDPDVKAIFEFQELLRQKMLKDEDEGKVDGVD